MNARRPTKKQKRARNTVARARILENATGGLRMVGFVEFANKREADKQGLLLPPCYLIRNYPHASLYGTPGNKERYINHYGVEYILEAKWQNGSGSVDEKLPYLWECFLASPILNWIVFFDGNWWLKDRRGLAAVEWLRSRIAATPLGNRHFYVAVGYDELIALTHQLFLRAAA